MRNTLLRSVLLGGVIAASAFVSSTASADTTTAKDTPKMNSGDYAYEFEDDVMNGGAFGPRGAGITVMPRGIRRTLIRPRLNFVPELLKSVETI